MDDLIERFSELSRAEAHLGVSPNAPSGDEPTLTLEQERHQLGLRVLGERLDGSPPQGVNNYGGILLATFFETSCRLLFF